MNPIDFDPHRPAIDLQLHDYPALHVDGRPVALRLRHGVALLAMLVEADRPVGRTGVAVHLWSQAGAPLARARLRRLVHELNRRIGVALVQGDADTLWLDAERLRCDWLQSRRIARSILAGGSAGFHQAAPLLAHRAERVLEGFWLGSANFDDWLDASRREHGTLISKALQRLSQRWLDEGEFAAAASAADRLVAIDRCDEAGHLCAMAARAELGDAAGVEKAYFGGVEALREEFGMKPSAAFERAYAASVARCRHVAVATSWARLVRATTQVPAHLARRTPHGHLLATMA
jgi:DNA-binding SARP family transcriptional activator